MNHRKDAAEEQAIMLLTKVIQLSEQDRDALPGSAVKLVKAARRIMLKGVGHNALHGSGQVTQWP